jgi:hypothetical protein
MLNAMRKKQPCGQYAHDCMLRYLVKRVVSALVSLYNPWRVHGNAPLMPTPLQASSSVGYVSIMLTASECCSARCVGAVCKCWPLTSGILQEYDSVMPAQHRCLLVPVIPCGPSLTNVHLTVDVQLQLASVLSLPHACLHW